MKKIIFILTCLSTLGGHLVAQNPKWFKKAAKAQISIVTMNEKGDMLQSGSGFFIDKNGTALADYQLFKQASKAEKERNTKWKPSWESVHYTIW